MSQSKITLNYWSLVVCTEKDSSGASCLRFIGCISWLYCEISTNYAHTI